MVRVLDSHTEGEPTRLIVEGGPDLGEGPLAERARRLEREHWDFCCSVLMEPRGHEAVVGAVLTPPTRSDCAAGAVYFNTASALGMCGHATIGLAVSLAHLGRITPGGHRFETPVGVVSIDLHDANTVSVENVESYRLRKDVTVEVEGVGRMTGDVAWGGNWFFLTKDAPAPLAFERIDQLTFAAKRLRDTLAAQGVTGEGGAYIDHIEFTGPPRGVGASGRNFVLCPGGAYDRSPCGTGSSAKIACLAADGKLAPGEPWVQESIIDSTYRLTYRAGEANGVIPTITGRAYVTASAELLFTPGDPYAGGVRLDHAIPGGA